MFWGLDKIIQADLAPGSKTSLCKNMKNTIVIAIYSIAILDG
jgi:hypothetical protein